MNIPTDYKPGYEKARAIKSDIADNYIAHTHIGDPLGEAMAEDIRECGPEDSRRFITAAMSKGRRGGPAERAGLAAGILQRSGNSAGMARLFSIRSGCPHVSQELVGDPGGIRRRRSDRRLYHEYSKVLLHYRRVREQGVRRLGQNNRHMMEIFLPGGMYRDGDGWKLSVRIRIIHARIRRLLNDSEDWNSEAWGLPISAAHLGYAISAFSARLLKHMKTLGATYSDEEYASFMAVWRYSGHLMGRHS